MARKLAFTKALKFEFLYNRDQTKLARSFLVRRASFHTVAEVSSSESSMPVKTNDSHSASARSPRSTSLPGFSFDDSKNAYRSKTSWEIVRALAVFKLCSFDFLVNKNKEVSIRSFDELGA